MRQDIVLQKLRADIASVLGLMARYHRKRETSITGESAAPRIRLHAAARLLCCWMPPSFGGLALLPTKPFFRVLIVSPLPVPEIAAPAPQWAVEGYLVSRSGSEPETY